MPSNNHRVLTRNVRATVIPAGDVVDLPVGTEVDITHRLGGNFTIVCDFGMFRIDGKDAEAIGEEIPETAASQAKKTDQAPGELPSEESLWDALKTVFDPEIPVNIVDLGLVYSLQRHDAGEGTCTVEAQMTLTAPGCGMGPAIAEDAKNRLEAIPGVSQAQVDIVWDPPWNQNMITEEGKMELGLI